MIRRTARNLILGAAATALLGLASAPIHAQASGTTDVDIDFPPILILYYFSDVDVQINPGVLDDFLGASATAGTTANLVEHFQQSEGSAGTVVATASGGVIEADLGDPGGLPGSVDLSDLTLTLVDSWAVRALASGTSSQYQIKVRRGDGVAAVADIDLVNGASTITITDSRLREGAGAYSNEDTFQTLTVPGLVTPHQGDVQLDLDLTAMSLPGLHSSAGGTDFTIIAEHL